MNMALASSILFFALLPAVSSAPIVAQQPMAAEEPALPGVPTSGGYKPLALTESDPDLSDAFAKFMQSGDSGAFRKYVEVQAANGRVAAQLVLGEQYIPEQCTFEPNRDAPHCGKDGDETPKVKFRGNPLGIPASYEGAARWLEHASENGSGEASEVLAQLITRMLANGHPTSFTAADASRLHALARSQGFDVEPLAVTCYQLSKASDDKLSVIDPPGIKEGGPPNAASFPKLSDTQLAALQDAGVHGVLRYTGSSGFGESVLLTRPEGPPVKVIVIMNHDPGKEVHLPIPAHHDEIFVQSGNDFLSDPRDAAVLPRFFSIMPQRDDYRQVTLHIQNMAGGFSGLTCGSF